MTQVFEGVRYTGITCGKCSIRFFVTEKYQSELAATKDTFYCPNGHPRAYVESTEEKLRRERDQLKQRLAEWQDAENDQRLAREAAERSAAARKGVITRMKKRTAAGKCPCCRRNFAALAQHMAHMHPQYLAEEVQ